MIENTSLTTAEMLLVEREQLNARIAGLEKVVEELRAEQASYKAQVLETARRHKNREDWCNDGFYQAMEDLDIEVERRFLVTVRLNLETEVAVVATNAEVAAEKAGYLIPSEPGFIELAADSDGDVARLNLNDNWEFNPQEED